MIKRFHIFLILLICLVTGALAQKASDKPTSATPVAGGDFRTTDTLAALTKDLAAAEKAAQDAKTADPNGNGDARLQILAAAREQLNAAESYTSQTAENEQLVREAPGVLKKLQEAAAEDEGTSGTRDEGILPTTATAAQLSEWIDRRKADLATRQEYLQALNAENEKRPVRASEMPKESAETRRQLDMALLALGAGPGQDGPDMDLARRLQARSQILAALARQKALDSEQAKYDSHAEIVPLGRQVLNERVAWANDLISSQTERLNDLQRQEASASAMEIRQAQREANTSHPLLRAAAEQNARLAEQLDYSALVDANRDMSRKLTQVQAQSAEIQAQHQALRDKFKAIGFSDAMGILLRKQRNDLPNRHAHREALATQEALLVDLNLKSFELKEQSDAVADPAAAARAALVAAGLDPSTTDSQSIRRDLTALLQARKDYLGRAGDAYGKYFQTLLELNVSEADLLQATTDYASFINERILWMPSAGGFSAAAMLKAINSLVVITAPEFWMEYARQWWRAVKQAPVAALLSGLFILLIVLSRVHWKRRLNAMTEGASSNRLAAISPLFRSLVYAALFVAPLPLLLLAMGLPFYGRYDAPLEDLSIASGFVWGAVNLFLLLFARTLIRKNGIAEVFFGWPEASLKKLRHVLMAFGWVFIPTVVIVRASIMWDLDSFNEISRIALVITVLLLAGVVWYVLKPSRSVFLGTSHYVKGTWLYRLRYGLWAGPVLLCLLFVAALLTGYIYTCVELAVKAATTAWLAFGAALLNEIIFFWILVKRRRLAIEEGRRRREQIKVQQAAENQAGTELPPVPAEPALDIAAISNQAGRLLYICIVGLFLMAAWAVWANMLPALQYLDTQALWTAARTVTVKDLLVVILAGAVAVAGLRNIPGLLDITLFQKFSVQAGERYAFNTLSRYVIIIISVIYVFFKLGLEWKQVQWLAAAVSVGLGFGMQEIFANFVSGLILLFERPVRVGDIVTVGDISGRVTQIRIRATTIMNWDHKEFIIPNKDLITKQVLNWTLSDKILRMQVKVGVNYGADYNQVREILLRIARENPLVLDDPAPSASLENLGPSSVDFTLAVHLPGLEGTGDVRHDIITQIDREFRQAGISIPYPTMAVQITSEDGKGKL